MLIVKNLNDSLILKDISYILKGELNIPMRYFFSKKTSNTKVNLHVCEKDHGFIELNLTFRDWLRKKEKDRKSYEALKYKIIKYPDAVLKVSGGSFSQYNKYKDDFIKSILKKSGYKGMNICFCLHDKEREAAKKFRDKYFRSQNVKKDTNTWIFDHKDHKHFVLYKGVDIIGYAHVQLGSEQNSPIKIIVVDAKYKAKGYDREFKVFIEKWLKFHNVHS